MRNPLYLSSIRARLSGLCLALALGACGDEGEPEAKGDRIYASVSSSHEVLVLGDDSHEILERYSVGEGPAIILATPDHKKLYTANWADNTVSAIDLVRGTVKNISAAERPYVIALDPAGTTLYAGLNTNSIAVIDTRTDDVTRSIVTQDMPASVIVSPDGKTLYVASLNILGLGVGKIQALSAESGEVIHPNIDVGRIPAWITITPDGSKVYTLNFLSDDVSVVDTASWKVTATIPTGAGTQGIIGGVTPDGSRLYVTNHGSSDMIAIDTATNEIVQTIKLTGRPVGVNFNADGSRVYVTDFGPSSLAHPPQITYLLTGKYDPTGPGNISVFDVKTGELVGPVAEVDPGPTSVVVAPRPD